MHLSFQNIITYMYEIQFLQNLLHVGIEGIDFNPQFTIIFVHNIKNNGLIELYIKSLPKLQFVYSKRKVSTKLIYAPKRGKRNLDWSMRQPMSGHCTSRESSLHCPHHPPTRIPKLLPYLGWATMGSRRI